MTSKNILQLEKDLKRFKKAEEELSSAKHLLSLVGKKGHSDGKWHKYPDLNMQVAYQENIGGNNYHKSESLNRVVNHIICEQWESIIATAVSRLEDNVKLAKIDFDKYEILGRAKTDLF